MVLPACSRAKVSLTLNTNKILFFSSSTFMYVLICIIFFYCNFVQIKCQSIDSRCQLIHCNCISNETWTSCRPEVCFHFDSLLSQQVRGVVTRKKVVGVASGKKFVKQCQRVRRLGFVLHLRLVGTPVGLGVAWDSMGVVTGCPVLRKLERTQCPGPFQPRSAQH